MLASLLFAAQAPKDLTVPNALARTYLHRAGRIAVENGFADLQKSTLPLDDSEVRLWGGLARGTKGIVLRERSGRWTAILLGRWKDDKPVELAAPKSGWPTFWKRAEALGVWRLPDETEFKDRRGYSQIADGYSNLVETQREGRYRAYAYNNPQHQTQWPSAKPMTDLDRLVGEEFPAFGRN